MASERFGPREVRGLGCPGKGCSEFSERLTGWVMSSVWHAAAGGFNVHALLSTSAIIGSWQMTNHTLPEMFIDYKCFASRSALSWLRHDMDESRML
jgi:hypothetical protein